MSFDKETMLHIENRSLALSQKLPETDNPAVFAPNGMGLISLENFENQPYRHKGRFHTQRIQSFIDYVLAHKEYRTQLFVNDREMCAEAAFDHFDAQADAAMATGWREHLAIIEMQETSEWSALTKHDRHNGYQFTQREFLDFINDWSHVLTFKEKDDEGITDIPIGRVYQSIQKLEVKATNTATHEEKDFRQSRGKLEELDIKGADSNLPATMHMACSTHIGLEPTVVECRLMVLSSENKVALGYRINALDRILDESANDFSDKIVAGTGDIPLWMGDFTR
ncbi:MAG TPA: DUF2303 family protein [Gammaproteobacteria bacterium]|nr:DUF2303 family protein [Gammaproteobacteria bacterium]